MTAAGNVTVGTGMTGRAAEIAAFLDRHGWGGAERRPLAGDASARRYERLVRGTDRAVLMDEAADGDVRPFLAVGRLLDRLGLSVPNILGSAPERRLLLLEDFGDATFGRLLAAGGDERRLYGLAVDVLIAIHRRFRPEMAADRDLPCYLPSLLIDQAMLFTRTYVPAATGRAVADEDEAALRAAWDAVVPPACGRVPVSLMLRDYHVDNLIALEGRAGVRACGVLDFQDAGPGPAVYDLVSLLEDARRDVPDRLADAMRQRYLAAFPDLDRAAFADAFAALAAIRHTRVLAVFARLALARGKRHYLTHVPRVWRLLEANLRNPTLAPVARWMDRHVPGQARAAALTA